MTASFSRIIQGCMNWGSWGENYDASAMADLIAFTVDQGITTFDHADIYGDYSTEETFGAAFAKANLKRSDVQFISKCGIQMTGSARPKNKLKHYQYDASYIVESAERSLEKLQTSYLDLFLIHRPSPLMDPKAISEAITELKERGKIKAFGVSNFTPSQTRLIQSKVPISANQIEISLTCREPLSDGQLDYMQTENILPMCWRPLGTFFSEDTPQNRRIKKAMKPMRERYDAEEDQLLLAWLCRHPANIHPVIGTTKKSRIASAQKASSIELSLQDWFALTEASAGHEVA